MGRKRRPRGDGDDPRPRRGMRRSIRFDAAEEWPEERRLHRGEDAPPEIMLRKLKLLAALERVEFQLRAHAARGTPRVLVVHGKGSSSPGGVSILGPEVRKWCDAHPGLVVSWQEAPPRWGGAGAIVVNLRT